MKHWDRLRGRGGPLRRTRTRRLFRAIERLHAHWETLCKASFRYADGCSLAIPQAVPPALPEPVVTVTIGRFWP